MGLNGLVASLSVVLGRKQIGLQMEKSSRLMVHIRQLMSYLTDSVPLRHHQISRFLFHTIILEISRQVLERILLLGKLQKRKCPEFSEITIMMLSSTAKNSQTVSIITC